MSTKTSLQELKQSVEPYLFFWEEWTRHGECFLTREETNLVNTQLKNGFKPTLLDLFQYDSQSERIHQVSQKLMRNYPVFKEWVIFNFLCILIKMGTEYTQGSFLGDPISDLRLPEEMKLNLKAFRLHHLGELGRAYQAIDLKRSWVYDTIVDFHRLHRKYGRGEKESLFLGQRHVENIP